MPDATHSQHLDECSFPDVPKMRTVTPLKSRKTEVNETLFAASVPMKQETDTGVLPAHCENGDDKSDTRCLPSWLRCAVPRLPTTPRAPGGRHPGRVPVGGTVCRRESRLARSGERFSTGSTRHTARRNTTLGAQRHQPPTSSGALPKKFQPHFRQVSGTRQAP